MAQAVVVAAGGGRRFGGDKLFRPLLGEPVLVRAVRPLLTHPQVERLVVVVAPERLEQCEAEIRHQLPSGGTPLAWVQGGASRQESVLAGLKRLGDQGLARDELVLIHDGARPFIGLALIDRVLAAAAAHGAAVPVVPPRDTIKVLEQDSWVADTPPRGQLGAAQTPQAFLFGRLLKAHALAKKTGAAATTDDAGLMEAAGFAVRVVKGEPENIKLTYAVDWGTASYLARAPAADRFPHGAAATMRIGYGYDLHPLVRDRPLVLGGVTIPWELGLAGHSDADVLSHALADALLGAAGLPDIGHQFPPADPDYKDADSLQLLRQVRDLVADRGYGLVNVDATVIAEAPALAPHREAICGRVAAALDLAQDAVSVKATTHEGMDSLGQGQAIAVHAIALLVRL